MEIIPWSWVRRLNVVKMAILPKLNYRLNIILVRIPADLFVETDEPIVEFRWNCKGPRTVKAILRRKQTEGFLLCVCIKILWKDPQRTNSGGDNQ